MKRKVQNVSKIFCVVSISLGLLVGCGGMYSTKITNDRYEIHVNGLLHGNNDSFSKEAKKVCNNRFKIIDKYKCGSSCVKGIVQCE